MAAYISPRRWAVNTVKNTAERPHGASVIQRPLTTDSINFPERLNSKAQRRKGAESLRASICAHFWKWRDGLRAVSAWQFTSPTDGLRSFSGNFTFCERRRPSGRLTDHPFFRKIGEENWRRKPR